jgi:hypothetical protein
MLTFDLHVTLPAPMLSKLHIENRQDCCKPTRQIADKPLN